MNVRRLIKKLIPQTVFRAVEPYGHLAEAVALNVAHGFPARGLKVIGVTGTNGKTTTAFLIHKMLSEAGYKVGLMTTIAYGAGDTIRPQGSHMTTVPVPQLLKRIQWMRDHGMEWLVLETTSHALAQYRVWGIPYSVAVFTNLTHEHLDYHGTFERYRAAKVRLFKLAARNRHGLQAGVVNADDPSAPFFERAVPNVVTYGLEHGDLGAEHIKTTSTGSSFTAHYQDTTLHLSVHLPGLFNVSNALAAAAVGAVVGLSDEQIERGIAALKSVPGRMERIDEGQAFDVFVDFAVTPDALEQALKTLRASVKGKIRLVFGATGDRDKAKRPLMGEVAARFADVIYLTDDETYTEDPETIRDAVYAGIKRTQSNAKTNVVPDRRQAIKQAFADARPGDAVLLAGMGHLTSRNMGGVEEPWDERDVARLSLNTSYSKKRT